MSSDGSNLNDNVRKIIGGSSAVMNLAAFTVIGYIALENVAYGALAGVFAGIGTGLFLPWFLQYSAAQNQSADDLPTETGGGDGDTSRLGLVGLGLELGGITMLAIGFALAEPDFVSGTVAAVAVALTVPVVASELMGG
ncbi:hypothetical protein [Halostella salina]|uniref:hypothetical protein n=1 Tax=Halostella salina TaxID=1547897 RepID=UPI000EF7877C|nr:hypothetical protein [Halostella salina]